MAIDLNNDVNSPHVWIVTTVFNRFDALDRYLDCLSKQKYHNFRLILVDHGTQDVQDHTKVPDYAVLIKSTPDKWWTAAVNVGLDYILNQINAPDEDIIILQNDDSTFKPDFLSSLVKVAKQENAVVGAVAVDRRTGKILHANMKFDPWRAKYKYLYYGEDVSSIKGNLLESDVLKGRGTAYPVRIVRKIGLMEERLPQYKSDHEWSHRANRMGFRVLVTPKVIVETVIDTQEKMEVDHPFRQFFKILFGMRSTSNLRDSFCYFTICYGPFLGGGCFLNSTLRTVTITFIQMIKALFQKNDKILEG